MELVQHQHLLGFRLGITGHNQPPAVGRGEAHIEHLNRGQLFQHGAGRKARDYSSFNFSIYIMCDNASAGKREAKDAILFTRFAGSGVMGLGSGRRSDGDCAAAGSQSRLGSPGAGAGAEDRPAHQFSDRRPSPFAEMEPVLRAWIEQAPGLSLAELCERLAAQGIAIKICALWHQLNKWNLTFKKKTCTPASKNAPTCSRHERHGCSRYPRWKSKSSSLLMKRGYRPA